MGFLGLVETRGRADAEGCGDVAAAAHDAAVPIGAFALLKESRFKLALNVTDTLDGNSVLEMFLSIAPNQSGFFFLLYYS